MKKHLKSPIKLILVLTFFVMLLFNIMVPLITDDFCYSFSYVDDTRITSISQIIGSLVVHRQIVNGRLVAHFFVFFFRMFPDGVFNVFNALNAAFLVWIAYRYYRSDNNTNDALTALFGIFLVWIFTPTFGEAFLWLAGSLNYSWGASFMLVFLLPFVKKYFGNRFDIPLVLKIFLIPFSFLAGAYSESISSATIFTAFFILLFITIENKRVDVLLTLMLFAAACGYLFLVSSPATRNVQLGGFKINSIISNFRDIILIAKNELLPLYILYGILFALNLRKGIGKTTVFSLILVASSLFEYFALSFASYVRLRPMFISSFYLAFACQLLFAELLRLRNIEFSSVIFSVVTVVFLFNFVIGTIDIGGLYYSSLSREAEISAAKEAGERAVHLTPYFESSKYSPIASNDLGDDPNIWPNNSIAAYYGFDEVWRQD